VYSADIHPGNSFENLFPHQSGVCTVYVEAYIAKITEMNNTIQIQCPEEILLGLHLDANQFSSLVAEAAAVSLFREGKLSSGMAARWLGIPRVHFLLKAMGEENVCLLENTEDDFNREISLL